MDSKKAKFFCENCGAEVLSKARFCPHCGKFFSAVRCPNCNYTGSVSEFRTGCPVCHYSDTDNGGQEAAAPKTADGLKHKLSKQSKKQIRKAFDSYTVNSTTVSNDTPVWVLIMSIIFLVAALIGIFIFLRK